MPFLLEGAGIEPDLNLDDGMHPNEKGVFDCEQKFRKKILEILN